MKRIAVAGAGGMARVRTQAFLAAKETEVCGVAARHAAFAEKFGAEVGCDRCFDDYRKLMDTRPDAILVEVPHRVQDEVVLWAIDSGVHVLIGGCLATRSDVAEKIRQRAQAAALVVEAGYQARYSAAWEAAKDLVRKGRLGRLVAVRSIALWPGDPTTWYYDQRASGGMPLTHMTYCYINPIRWIVGNPRLVSAFANRIRHTGPDMVEQETCVANLVFDDDVLCSMTAGYVKGGDVPAGYVTFLGTEAALDVRPSNGSDGGLTLYVAEGSETVDVGPARDAFEVQAEVFLTAIDGPNACRNTPEDTIHDVRIAEAIATSARRKRTVSM